MMHGFVSNHDSFRRVWKYKPGKPRQEVGEELPDEGPVVAAIPGKVPTEVQGVG